jgi:CRP/FNR family transcriptional regulator
VIDVIKMVPALSHVSATNQRLLQEHVQHRVVSRRAQIILHKGEPVSGAYFVLSGRLRVFTVSPNGTEATLYYVRDLTLHAQSNLVYRLMQELEQIHGSNFRQRLAQYILLHADPEGHLHTTQQQLARHLGTSREVIGRLVSEMVSRGLLRSARGRLDIRDLFGLRGLLMPKGRLPDSRRPTR